MPQDLEAGQSTFIRRCLVSIHNPGFFLAAIVCMQIMCTLFGLWYLTDLTYSAVCNILASVQALKKSTG
jgi:hypothetical protein